MTEYEGDVLTSGPGSPSASIRKPSPEDEYAGALSAEFSDLDDDDDDIADSAPQLAAGRLRAALTAPFTAESLALAAAFLLAVTLFARNLLLQLAASASGLATKTSFEALAGDSRSETLNRLYSAYNALSAGVAMTAVIAGAAGLLLAGPRSPRWARAVAGAAVLVGLALGGAHLAASRTGSGLAGLLY